MLKGFSQEIISELLGLSSRQYSDLENSKRIPSLLTFITIIIELDFRFDDFIRDIIKDGFKVDDYFNSLGCTKKQD